MPIKLSIGLSKKVGLPDYGSLGASCTVEVELEASLLQSDLEGFHGHVRRAYAACAQAVNNELHRNLANAGQTHVNESNGTRERDRSPSGNGSSDSATNGANRLARKATQSQIRALIAMADRRGLHLDRLASDRFHVQRAADLALADASQLIDELKATPVNGGRR